MPENEGKKENSVFLEQDPNDPSHFQLLANDDECLLDGVRYDEEKHTLRRPNGEFIGYVSEEQTSYGRVYLNHEWLQSESILLQLNNPPPTQRQTVRNVKNIAGEYPPKPDLQKFTFPSTATTQGVTPRPGLYRAKSTGGLNDRLNRSR